jgi:O-antigen/teichoic acid export membrane protein
VKLDTLDPGDVARCVGLVGIASSLRLISGVYRGGLLGLEHQVSANAIAVAIATLRFVAVVPILIWVSNSVLAFFGFQLVIAVVAVALLRIMLRRSLPGSPIHKFQWELLREPVRFASRLAFLTCMWIAISQADKLILSHLLPMQEYGGFTLATTIALGTILLVSPLQQAVLPRLIVLAEREERAALVRLYRQTTILMASVLAGVGGVMVAFPVEVLYSWTGHVEAASQASEVLRWYAAGTCFMGMTAMSYLLQHAHGDLGLHIKGNLVCLLILIPAVIFSTLHYGAVGAAIAWATTNLLFLLFWTPVVHGRFLPEIRTAWLFRDVFPALSIAAGVVLLSRLAAWPLASRTASLLSLVSLAVLIVAAALSVHPETRQLVLGPLRKIGKHA